MTEAADGRGAFTPVPGMHVPDRWSLPSAGPLRLVVLGDSTAHLDDRGPQFPQAPHLYPRVAAATIAAAVGREVAVSVVARPGTTSRDLHRTLTRDVHVMFEEVLGADAIVVGVGSFDHAPRGIPTVVEALLPHVRPARLRRRVRAGLRWLHPRLVAAGGRHLTRTPARDFARHYDGVLAAVRGLSRGAPTVALGPTSHRSDHYAHSHPRHAEAERRQAAVAARHGVPVVASWPLVEPHAGDLNPDGIHWPPAAHRAVGQAVGRALAEQLTGARPTPSPPSWS